MVANTLADLTRRQYRFAHNSTPFPYACDWGQLGLPTLAECSGNWKVGNFTGTLPAAKAHLDFWSNRTSTTTDSYPWADTYFGSGSRLSDDIILNNVIGFDVKAWDPTAPTAGGGQGAYVDLGGGSGNKLGGYGDMNSQLRGSSTTSRIYDTWSTTYLGDNANNGLDDDNNGIVDDDAERAHPSPYPVPLRGIQVKIRTFEPDSKQIREVTVVQDFLPQ